jgi:hypothetical protein
LTWTSRIGQTYRLQFRDSFAGGTWTNLGAPILATTADDTRASPKRFYRIIRP